jgi:polar amino acid transport system substrate-binding protein
MVMIITMWRLIPLLFLFAGCAGVQSTPTDAERQSLAPTGKLRVALLLGSPAYLTKERTTGEMKGVGFDLGKELAQRSGLPFEPVIYPSVVALIADMKTSAWDVAFLARTPERQKVMDFSEPFYTWNMGSGADWLSDRDHD